MSPTSRFLTFFCFSTLHLTCPSVCLTVQLCTATWKCCWSSRCTPQQQCVADPVATHPNISVLLIQSLHTPTTVCCWSSRCTLQQQCVADPVAAHPNNSVLLIQSLHTPTTACCLHFSHQIPYFQMAGDAYADRPRPHRRPFCEAETRRRRQVWTDLKCATGWQQQCPALRALSSAPMTRRDTRYYPAPGHGARRCCSHWRSRTVYCWTMSAAVFTYQYQCTRQWNNQLRLSCLLHAPQALRPQSGALSGCYSINI